MANWQDPQGTTGASGGVSSATVSVPRAARDVGLRSYMLSVYNYMASGVLLTGMVAMLLVNSPLIRLVFDPVTGRPTFLPILALLASLGVGMWLQAGIMRMSLSTAKSLFFVYAALLGIGFSTIFIAYTGVSIAQTFFATAGAFLGLSLWGYTTKRDLSGWGSFLIMGVVGILVALLANVGIAIFTGHPSTTLDLAVSAIGVLIFAGLTAYDTQVLKSIYVAAAGNGEATARFGILGAFRLYLDFVNMFLFLLRFMGNRR
jgi:FtsH-binding integral membrane protein